MWKNVAGNIDQLVEWLPNMHKALGSIPSTISFRHKSTQHNLITEERRKVKKMLKVNLRYVASSIQTWDSSQKYPCVKFEFSFLAWELDILQN